MTLKQNVACWFEIYVNDMDRAKKFYSTVLNLELADAPEMEGMPDMKMAFFPWVENAIPKLIVKAFEKDKNLKSAFEKLTSGKQKEYSLYINEAKQEATKIKRLEKIIPMILQGIGLYDKYKNC